MNSNHIMDGVIADAVEELCDIHGLSENDAAEFVTEFAALLIQAYTNN